MRKSDNSSDVISLIFRVRAGDDDAFDLLLETYKPLIEASVMRALEKEAYSLYADDFKQEATVVFYNAILTYDVEQHEVEFGLYAKICISNALISQVRRLTRRSGERLADMSEEGLFINDFEDPSVKILERESLRALYSVIRGSLSEFEYRIWQLYLSGRTAKEIGDIVGKTDRSISNAIYRIRKKLRTALHETN